MVECDIDIEDRKIWRKRYGYEAQECVLTRVHILEEPTKCACREICKKALEEIKK